MPDASTDSIEMTASSSDRPPAHLAPGVCGVLATPFAGHSLAVDLPSLGRQVELYRKLSATGLVALGVFGEAGALSPDERLRVITAAERFRGELPLVVGISALSTASALDQATSTVAAVTRPLAGLMVMVHTAVSDELVSHLTSIYEATGTGIVVQDYPMVSGVHIDVDDLAAAVRACPFVVAVKSESPPSPLAVAQLTSRVDVPVFGGLGGVGLLDELAAGAAGAMTGFSHPEGLLSVIRAWNGRDFEAARSAICEWLPLANFEAQPGIGLAIRKQALFRRGVLDDPSVRPPTASMPSDLVTTLEAHLNAVRLNESHGDGASL